MPVEIIGEAGTPDASREWLDAECQLAICPVTAAVNPSLALLAVEYLNSTPFEGKKGGTHPLHSRRSYLKRRSGSPSSSMFKNPHNLLRSNLLRSRARSATHRVRYSIQTLPSRPALGFSERLGTYFC